MGMPSWEREERDNSRETTPHNPWLQYGKHKWACCIEDLPYYYRYRSSCEKPKEKNFESVNLCDIKTHHFYSVTSKTCYQLLQLHFLRWNIVFFSSLIIAIIVLSLVVGSSVWDVQEKRLWCSCSSTRRNLICGSWISWSFLIILSSEIMWYTRVYQHVNLLWKQYASDFVLTHYLPASTHHQSDQSLRLWVISIRKMYPSDSFLEWFDSKNTFLPTDGTIDFIVTVVKMGMYDKVTNRAKGKSGPDSSVVLYS